MEDDERARWEKGMVIPLAKEMKARGIAYLLITIRDDGKAAYVLDNVIPENARAMTPGAID